MTCRRSQLILDAGLLLGAFGVPFAFGGRHSIGEFLLVCSAILCSIGWLTHQLCREQSDWVPTRVEPLLLAIIALVLVQIVPLPQSVIGTLSPAMDDVMPLRTTAAIDDGVFQAPWSHLSMSVGESTSGLAIAAAYILIFLVAAQRIRTADDASRMLKLVAVSGVAMTAFAFIQFLCSNGLYFWMIDLPQGVADDRLKGAFLNKNHFAQFAALSIGPLVWWLGMQTNSDDQPQFRSFGSDRIWQVPKPVQTMILSAALGMVVTAIAISRARGAFVAMTFSAAILVTLLYLKSLINRKQFLVMAAAAVMGTLLLGIVGHREISRVNERLNNWDSNGRVQIWNANVDVFAEFPLLGTGVGTHAYIHQRHLDQPFSTGRYSHAESGYLQIATETGIAGLVLMTFCLLASFRWCLRGVRHSQSRTVTLAFCGITCSLLISCIQSVADFVWYIPGCMVPLILQLACACRLYQLDVKVTGPARNRSSAAGAGPAYCLSRPAVVLSGLCLLLVSGWMISEWTPRLLAEPYWSNYRRIVLASHTGKDVSEPASGDADQRVHRLQQLVQDLRNAVKRNPDDSRIHTRLAVQYIQAFHLMQQQSDNALPLNQIRDAAETGGFETHEQMLEWLGRAFGNNIRYALAAKQHARRAIELNPLDGRAWLAYSELAFLDGAPVGYDRKCIDQCLRLLPNDAAVLYAAGRDARVDGDVESWAEYWKKAFHRDREIQEQIILQMAEWTEFPVEIIASAFDPDVAAVEQMVDLFDQPEQQQNLNKALLLLAARLTERAQSRDNRERASDWRKAAAAYARSGRIDEVEACFVESLRAAPTDFRIRFDFGLWLLDQERPASATEHLQWCSRMAPHDDRVDAALSRLRRSIQRNSNIQQAGGLQFDPQF